MEQIPRLADGTPSQLGRYRIVRPISTGGMARVFEARRESIAGVQPRVAIKVILPDFAEDEAFRQLFINEARVGSMIQHQNLVQIQDFDSAEGLFYLVMEYVDGITLRRVINICRKQGIPIPLPIIAEIGRQVCDGLHYAHAVQSPDGHHLQLVHRDIKPSNVMLNPQGVLKLLDFGISKALIADERRGAIRGTWGYMSPEQAVGQNVGFHADLFGLAVVLYEMATLSKLFSEKEPDVLRDLLARDEAARRATRLTGEYDPLVKILVRALQRDPLARYNSAAAMGRAFTSMVPDPISMRQTLIRFQQSMVEFNQPGARRQERPRSAATMDRASRGGLPVLVGDREAPHDLPDATPIPVSRPSAFPGALLVCAILIVAVTAWQLAKTSPYSPFETTPSVEENLVETQIAAPEPEQQPLVVEPVEEAVEAPSEVPQPAASDEVAPVEPPPVPIVQPESAQVDADQPSTNPAEGNSLSGVDEPVAVEDSPIDASVEAGAGDQGGSGFLTISSDPRAQVVIDGKFVRYSPMFRYELPTGTYQVTLIADDSRQTTFSVMVPEGGDVRRIWNFALEAWVE